MFWVILCLYWFFLYIKYGEGTIQRRKGFRLFWRTSLKDYL